MDTAVWKHILGNTWSIESHLTIPVYFLNDREVVLLDSGYADRDRAMLDTLLAEKSVRVRAILGSHSHNDHNGNHAYFQKAHGAEVILRDMEAAIVSDFALMTAAYHPAAARDLEHTLPHLLLKADRTFSPEADRIEIDGRSFGLIPLPGHTFGQTGIVTPDNVLYVADAVVSTEVLAASKLPSTMDWLIDLDTKYRLMTMGYPCYVLAHRGVYGDIRPLVEENITDKIHRAEQIADWLSQKERWSQSEVEQLLWKKLDLHSKTFMARTIFQRNVRCALEYLIQIKTVTQDFDSGTVWYQIK